MQSTNSKNTLRLIVRRRELKAIYDLFKQVDQFNESKKRRWLDENSQLVAEAFMSFLEMNRRDMNLVNLDDEAGQISLEIIDLLEETTRVMEQAFDPKGKLEA